MHKKAPKSMASNKDMRRPLYCAADDDPFPLPDYLAPIADREPVQLHNFVNSTLPKAPPIPAQDSKGDGQVSQPTYETKDSDMSNYRPRTAIVAALQPSLRVTPSNPLPPPTFNALLGELRKPPTQPSAEPSAPQEKFTVVNIAVYNSQSPTKSADFTFSAVAPLMTLINQIPCKARPNLINVPSPSLLYIGNTIYNQTLPRRPNYALPIQKFLRKHCITKPPEILPLTESTPTFEQLTLTLGAPYPFIHHGDCEHLIIFTDIFRTHQELPISSVQHQPLRLTPCDVCRRRAADRFTVADPIADTSPFHYCATCFRQAHYSLENEAFERNAGFRQYRQYVPM